MYNPDSGYAKESVKWESQPSNLGLGKRPYAHRTFPMMLHKAGNLPGGGLGIVETMIVGSVTYREDGLAKIPIGGTDDEPARLEAYSRGFRDTPLEAVEYFETQQLEFAKLHAEREYEKKHKLSPNAVAEINAIEDIKGSTHLPTIPETPINRKRGRPKKAAVAAELAKRAVEG